MVSDPERYIWSSHRAYMGLDEFVWLAKERVLKKFHHDRKNAVKNYEKFVLKGIGIETEFDFKSGSFGGIVGETEFVDEVLMKANVKQRQKKIELSQLIAKICEMHDLTEKELCSLSKHARQSQARALLAFLVRETNNLSLENLGRFLGRNPSGLTKLATRLEIKSMHSEVVSKKLNEIRHWLSTV